MSKLAVQMYTLRDYTATASELSETFKKVSDMGYTAVQMSAISCMGGDTPLVDAAEARKILDDNGLKCIATHRDWNSLLDNTSFEIDFHQTIGCDYAAVGGVPNDYDRSIEGYRKWIADGKDMIAKLKAEGIRFGHHNHSHEFYKEEPHGPTLEDILIDEGGEDLHLELDLYWVDNSGACPMDIVTRGKGRVSVIHIKDKEVIAGTNDTRMAPIGEGVLYWDGIIAACEAAGVDWYAVEQDTCYRDPFDCMKSSFDYLTSKGI